MVSDVVMNEDGSTTVMLSVADTESSPVTLSVAAASGQPALLPHPTVGTVADPAQRELLLAPVANGHGGPVTVTLTINDPIGASSQRTFQVTVLPVNDAPALTLGTLSTHPAATSGVQSVPTFANVDFGPADEDTAQAVDDFLIDSVTDPDGVFAGGAVDVANNGALSYTLSGIGGSATITVRVRDNGGTANGGVNTSSAQQFTITVTPGADLQVAKDNHRVGLLDGETVVYAIVVANAGPNAVAGATLTDTLPAALINGAWQCVPASSTATCPLPASGVGNLSTPINLGVGQYLRFDVVAEVDGSIGAFVTNSASVSLPSGITALDTANDTATDQDPIVPIGLFLDGFETSAPPPTVPGAVAAMRD